MSLPLIPFTTEQITGCTNEMAKGANKAPRNPTSFFLFHVLLFLKLFLFLFLQFSNDFMILIVSFKFFLL